MVVTDLAGPENAGWRFLSWAISRDLITCHLEPVETKKQTMIPLKQINVMVVEDHAVVRQGLCAILSNDHRFKVAGQARNGREAVQMVRAQQPDVVLMDIGMAGLNGLEATRQMLAGNPATKILILSAHSGRDSVERMIAAGVAGYIDKDSSAEILIQAIGEVAQGRKFFSAAIARHLPDHPNTPRGRDGLKKSNHAVLTSREAELLQLIAEGSTSKQVAAELGISIKTVEKHRQGLMDKLKIHDIAGLTRHAIAAGIVEGKTL
jgi:DNA-binding NarL/FixJ family response regulator